MTAHKLAIIGGDGIGPEVTDQGLRVLDALEQSHGFATERTQWDLGARRYLATGEVLSEDTIAALDEADAIYLGAIGDPDVPPGVLERGMLLALRFTFDQYVNHRPVKLYPGVASPVADLTPDRCDFVVVRENTESVYAGAGGTVHRATPAEVATQESINTRHGVERILRYAFDQAQARPRQHLTLCHKTNVLTNAGDLWWRTFHEVGEEYPDVQRDYVHVDAACLYFVTQPERFDVVVTENLFGDILTDLGAAVQGGMGLATSGNLNPTGAHPSMFEPVHGSAPDIAGHNTADPTAAVLALGLLLDSLGEHDAAAAVEEAVTTWLAERGDAAHSTTQIGDRLVELVA